MKAQMESTSKTIILNGMNFRVWEGISAKGVPFVALVNRLEAVDPAVSPAFIQEVMATQPTPKDTTQGALERLGAVPVNPPPTSTAA
jgi:hypothetical protein